MKNDMSKSKGAKRLKITIIVLLSIFCLSLITYLIDSSLADNGQSPVLSIRYSTMDDGGSACYLGLGYQIIIWNQLAEDHDGYMVGVEKHYLFGIRPFPNQPNISLERQNNWYDVIKE